MIWPNLLAFYSHESGFYDMAASYYNKGPRMSVSRAKLLLCGRWGGGEEHLVTRVSVAPVLVS